VSAAFGDEAFLRSKTGRPIVPGLITQVQALILLLPNLCKHRELLVVGVVINRWNITLSGLVAPPEWSPGILGNVIAVSYFPSLIEIGVGLGVSP
jgi:Ni/Fe-hydrogenase subunit HybB-like protein